MDGIFRRLQRDKCHSLVHWALCRIRTEFLNVGGGNQRPGDTLRGGQGVGVEVHSDTLKVGSDPVFCVVMTVLGSGAG